MEIRPTIRPSRPSCAALQLALHPPACHSPSTWRFSRRQERLRNAVRQPVSGEPDRMGKIAGAYRVMILRAEGSAR